MRNRYLLVAIAATMFMASCATTHNFYVDMSVPEEGGSNFAKMTDESFETLTNPKVTRDYNGRLTWWGNPLLAISNDGQSLAYNVYKNERRNIFVKSTTGIGSSVQRTFRSNVNDVTFSPDDKMICFSQVEGASSSLYTTNATQGAIVQKISPQNVADYAPRYSTDGSKIFFARQDGNNYSIWSYDTKNQIFNNYCYGMSPVPISDEELLCVRRNSKGNSEIWKVNYVKGTESIIVSSENQSYSTPSLSPDGKWILMVANTVPNGNKNEENLDVYVVRTDGTGLTQLTYHRGHDCSPIWGRDGKSIYFLSQRGTIEGNYNIWRMDFNLK